MHRLAAALHLIDGRGCTASRERESARISFDGFEPRG